MFQRLSSMPKISVTSILESTKLLVGALIHTNNDDSKATTAGFRLQGLDKDWTLSYLRKDWSGGFCETSVVKHSINLFLTSLGTVATLAAMVSVTMQPSERERFHAVTTVRVLFMKLINKTKIVLGSNNATGTILTFIYGQLIHGRWQKYL